MTTANVMKKLAIATAGTALAAFGTALPSMAGTLTYTGTTVGGATWNRPLSGNPPTSLSAVGTNVAYSVQEFAVDTTGLYNFLSVATNPTNWDNFLFLYGNSFNPTTPLTNAIVGNDDFPNIGRSGFNNVSLTAGIRYFLVTTGFGNSDAGSFSNTISGVGNITTPSTSVPEPASVLGLLAVGAMGAGSALKRKQQQKANV